MNPWVRLAAAALCLFLAAGCGGPQNDNTAIQTPDDQPIGLPQEFGTGGAKEGIKAAKMSGGGGGTRPGKIEIKTDP